MKVLILEAIERKGNRSNGSGEYHFTSVKVSCNEKDLEGWVTVDANVCQPSKIKKGLFAELRFNLTNNTKVARFDIVGDEPSGVVVEEPPVPEVPDYYPSGNNQ